MYIFLVQISPFNCSFFNTGFILPQKKTGEYTGFAIKIIIMLKAGSHW